MPAHRIHLKGPWEYEWLVRSETGTEESIEGRVKMPTTWQTAFGTMAGRVRFSRRFNCPTNLDENERIAIVFDGIGGCGRVSLNETILGKIEDSVETASFDVTKLLKPRNMLVVELQFDPSENQDRLGGLWGPVAIEINSE